MERLKESVNLGVRVKEEDDTGGKKEKDAKWFVSLPGKQKQVKTQQ